MLPVVAVFASLLNKSLWLIFSLYTTLRGMGEFGFERKRRAEQASNPAESTAHGRAGAMGSALPQSKAGHNARRHSRTARPGFLEPGKMGFLLTIDLEVLYDLLGVEVQEPDEKSRRTPSLQVRSTMSTVRLSIRLAR